MPFLFSSPLRYVSAQEFLARGSPIEFHLTITIFQLNQQGGIVHEVIVVGNNVVMLQQRQNNNLIQGIATFLLRQSGQINFLPHNQ